MGSLRQLFRQLVNADGATRDALRSFNALQVSTGRAQSAKNLANKLGVDVDREPLERGVSGFLERDAFAPSGYRIVVNSELSVQRQRWTVLHELGHYLLHRRTNDMFHVEYLDRSASAFYSSRAQEREADEFAATILFGDGALEAAASLHQNNIQTLAHSFGVTEAVVKIGMRQFLKDM